MDALAHTALFKFADLIYKNFRESILDNSAFFQESALREAEHFLAEHFDMDFLYTKYFIPTHKHESEYLIIPDPRARSYINESAVVAPQMKGRRK